MTNLGPVIQHRTQLYLPTSLYQKVKQRVREEGIFMAGFFRSLLKEEFKKEDKKEKEKAWREFYKFHDVAVEIIKTLETLSPRR